MKYRDFIKLSKKQQEIYWEHAIKKFIEHSKEKTAKRATA